MAMACGVVQRVVCGAVVQRVVCGAPTRSERGLFACLFVATGVEIIFDFRFSIFDFREE
jgi:hypothetical protein